MWNTFASLKLAEVSWAYMKIPNLSHYWYPWFHLTSICSETHFYLLGFGKHARFLNGNDPNEYVNEICIYCMWIFLFLQYLIDPASTLCFFFRHQCLFSKDDPVIKYIWKLFRLNKAGFYFEVISQTRFREDEERQGRWEQQTRWKSVSLKQSLSPPREESHSRVKDNLQQRDACLVWPKSQLCGKNKIPFWSR